MCTENFKDLSKRDRLMLQFAADADCRYAVANTSIDTVFACGIYNYIKIISDRTNCLMLVYSVKEKQWILDGR